MALALQDICLAEGTCYGCGSANPDGLHLKRMDTAKFGNLLEGQSGVLDEPDSRRLRHKRQGHKTSFVV